MKTVNILGQTYTIQKETSEQNQKLSGNDGLCEAYSKRLILDTESSEDDTMVVENVDAYYHRVLRHEAFHAIFFEAGIHKYYEDEELIDVLAILYPKIKVVMETMDKIDVKEL